MENTMNKSEQITAGISNVLEVSPEARSPKTYQEEWFYQTAQEAFARIGENTWDFSDARLLWTPKGAIAYTRLQIEGIYSNKIEDGERDFLKNVGDVVTKHLPEVFSLVDLGPGEGEESMVFLGQLKENGKTPKQYFAVDISQDMLISTQARKELSGINSQMIHATFEEGLTATKDLTEPRLITALGLSLFNSGIQGLDVIKNNLRPQDKAFLDIQPRERIDLQQVKQAYHDPKSADFYNAKLELIGLKIDESVTAPEMDDNMTAWVEVTKLNNFLTERGVQVGDKIALGKSYRPTLNEVINYFEKDGFRADVLDDGGEFVGLIVSKTTEKIDVSGIQPPVLDSEHPYRPYFEGEEGKQAYRRMVEGSLALQSYLEQFIQPGQKVMEVGPFYDPLITNDKFPQTEITYVDRDEKALDFLNDGKSRLVNFNFGVSDPAELNAIPLQDSIVTSHIINHIGLPNLVDTLKDKLKVGGYLFMNESIDYAAKELLHPDRPENLEEVLDYLRESGFRIVEYRIIPTSNPEYQPHSRFVIVATKDK
jgi:hypothetical protein